MPPTGYLSTNAIDQTLQYLANTYPTICQLIKLPEGSIEGRTIHVVKIGKGASKERRGILLIGGVHARELVNPDMLIYFAYKICYAYTHNQAITLGGKTFEAQQIQSIVDKEDVFILPLVNPDGRAFVMDPVGDIWWRKNRRVNSGSSCKGVDLNRNFDFLWNSGIGTSTSPCSEIYRGANGFSEPETRNVRSLLDNFPQIRTIVDVHSYSQYIMYSWGDDENQTTNASMNFTNPTYDGLRGILGDSYKEYITSRDKNWATFVANSVRDTISAVSGTVYQVKQSVNLYPTSGTSNDYSFGRHYADAAKNRVFGFAIETGTVFQPLPADAQKIITEVTAGMIQFCALGMCVVDEMAIGTSIAASLDDLRAFRNLEMLSTPAGKRYVQLQSENSTELLGILLKHPEIRSELVKLLDDFMQIIKTRSSPRPMVFERPLVEHANRFACMVAGYGSEKLEKAITEVSQDAHYFEGKTVKEGLRLASAARRPLRTKGGKKPD
jgi:carboxypeptidase T